MTRSMVRAAIISSAKLCVDALVLEQLWVVRGDLLRAAAMADSAQECSERAFRWSQWLAELPA